MKKLFLTTFVVQLITLLSCSETKKGTTNEKEGLAIGNIAFFTEEQKFDSVKAIFQESTNNPKWEDDMVLNYPYVYNDWGFDNIRGLFSNDGLLVGVVLSSLMTDGRSINFDNLAKLDSLSAVEFGNHIDSHQSPSEKIIKEKGEYAYKLFQKRNKCSLITYSSSDDILYENLYVYNADQIDIDESIRRIDNDLTELQKLK